VSETGGTIVAKSRDTWVGLLCGLVVFLVMSLFVLRDMPGRGAPYLSSFLGLLTIQIYRLERQIRRLEEGIEIRRTSDVAV
jgi:hypothetical protein